MQILEAEMEIENRRKTKVTERDEEYCLKFKYRSTIENK